MNTREVMTMNRHHVTKGISLCALSLLAFAAAHAAEIEPPKVQLVDKFGVNLANGQVTHRMDVVSIGGAMGLSDSISVYGNEFNFLGKRGFNHKFYGRAADTQIVTTSTESLSPRNVMRVYGPMGTADFGYYLGDQLQNYGNTTGLVYKPLGDERNALVVEGNDLVWTIADGTILRFDRGSVTTNWGSNGGTLRSIEYPNGFKISIVAGGAIVSTNTGFQLRQIFASDNVLCGTFLSSDQTGWTQRNPKYVVAVNGAYENCAVDNPDCQEQLLQKWPKARFDWPHCMHQTMFAGTNQATVINAQGVSTTYKFKAFDLSQNPDGSYVEGLPQNVNFSPRLISVSAPNKPDVPYLQYSYKNIFISIDGDGFGTWDHRLTSSGFVTGASRGDAGAPYDIARLFMYGPATENLGGQHAGVSRVRLYGMVPGAVGAVEFADTDDGTIFFGYNPRNFPTRYEKHSALNESYGYTRGNLSSITYYGAPSQGYAVTAVYPSSCAPPASPKTCNQASSITDANGNTTNYTYDDDTGQVLTITHPPNKRGVRAKTTYEYGKFGARYHDVNGIWVGQQPEWNKISLKTKETQCIDTDTQGTCTGGEVVTTFEYNHDNLLLTGMLVTDQFGATRRTCYRYDIFGNQIAVTTPNANLASCPAGSAP